MDESDRPARRLFGGGPFSRRELMALMGEGWFLDGEQRLLGGAGIDGEVTRSGKSVVFGAGSHQHGFTQTHQSHGDAASFPARRVAQIDAGIRGRGPTPEIGFGKKGGAQDAGLGQVEGCAVVGGDEWPGDQQAQGGLAAAGLADAAQRGAGTLSHGGKRQLEIAMCLATKPRVLLLDEPLAGMGAEETERMLALLHELKAGHAILLVEHDMDAVFRVADRITVMVNGSVIACDAPEAVRSNADVQAAYLGGH